ncbi:MAG TPA: hypothetical protein VGW34_10855, partial [Allosphingosinicella sp.]|nr:hypothetical protein [Allosphingosinicella sp.]
AEPVQLVILARAEQAVVAGAAIHDRHFHSPAAKAIIACKASKLQPFPSAARSLKWMSLQGLHPATCNACTISPGQAVSRSCRNANGGK